MAVIYLDSDTREGLYKCFDKMLYYIGMQNLVNFKLVVMAQMPILQMEG